MKNCNVILTDKQQKYQLYHQVKLININTLQVKKCCLLIKGKEKSNLAYSPLGKGFGKQKEE